MFDYTSDNTYAQRGLKVTPWLLSPVGYICSFSRGIYVATRSVVCCTMIKSYEHIATKDEDII